MSSRTRFLAVVCAVLVFSGVAPAQAAELTERQINTIISLLESFKAEPEVVRAVRQALLRPKEVERPLCVVWPNNLALGASGSEVVALQQTLQKDGQTVVATGVFDAQTALAVKAFQEKYASEILTPQGLTRGTGFVGRATRAKLSTLFNCYLPTQTVPGAVVPKAASTTATVATSALSATLVTGTGGTLDYTDDARVDQTDTQVLLEVAVGSRTCPAEKVCDLNKDGKTAASDALVLANYVGSQAKAGQYDYNDDYKIDAADVTYLQKVTVGTLSCPVGRVCDTNGDTHVNASDALLLATYAGSSADGA